MTSYRTRRRLGAVGAGLLVGLFAPPAGAAAGQLDVSFGTGGITRWHATEANDIMNAVAHRPDGRIISAGRGQRSIDGSTANEYEHVVTRHNPDGSLDPTFAAGGLFVTWDGAIDDRGGFFGGYRETIKALALRPDGRIVVAGCTHYTCVADQGSDHFVARFTADGALDPTFGGGDGLVRLDVSGTGSADGARAVAVDGNGRILTAGLVRAATFDVAVVALTSDGALDTTFGGGDGVVTTDFDGSNGDNATGIVIQPDGKAVVAGVGAGNFALARYSTKGKLDTTFGSGGKLTTDFGGSDRASDLALDASDRIVVAGLSGQTLAVSRYTTAGALDTTFSGDGRATAANFTVSATPFFADIGVEVQADGKPVVGGVIDGDLADDFGVARFTVSGALDSSFSGDGVTNVDVEADEDWGNDVSLDPAGNIVVAGGSDGHIGGAHDGEAVLMRFQADLAASACPGMTITNVVAGTPGDDALVGTAGSDLIYGLAGNDTITGADGDDCIYGGSGHDAIDAEAGNDRLFGESGNDILIGGQDLDKAVGGPGNDIIRITAGDVPAASSETLKGKAGTDTAELGAGLTNANVTGTPPTFSVSDPSTGGTYSAAKVELIVDT